MTVGSSSSFTTLVRLVTVIAAPSTSGTECLTRVSRLYFSRLASTMTCAVGLVAPADAALRGEADGADGTVPAGAGTLPFCAGLVCVPVVCAGPVCARAQGPEASRQDSKSAGGAAP